MQQEINGLRYVGTDFPPEEGAKLANRLMSENVDWPALVINLRGLPPSLLISGFFNGFLSAINAKNPDLLDEARRVRWELDHEFQDENVQFWMNHFKVSGPLEAQR